MAVIKKNVAVFVTFAVSGHGGANPPTRRICRTTAAAIILLKSMPCYASHAGAAKKKLVKNKNY